MAGRPGQQMNEDGFIIPNAMRNFREKKILYGFITLKRYDRIDILWGYFKDVEKDLLYAHIFVGGLAFLIFLYVLLQKDPN